jgi:hypothetical protein
MSDYLPELTKYCLTCHERHADGRCETPPPRRVRPAPLSELFGFLGYTAYVLIQWAVALGSLAALVWFVHIVWRLT